MASKKDRVEIPLAVAAEALFRSDRTCCVCRIKGKPVQLHHIDENPANGVLKNLAVLCFDCHTETQIRGGFHRKLDAEQVILYRNDWLATVSKERASNVDRFPDDDSGAIDLELATSLAEIYRENQEYELLALHYLSIGNDELRDKYIELAIQQGIDDDGVIFFRSAQDRLKIVPSEVIERRTKTLEERNDWFSLGRLYRTLGDFKKAAVYGCKAVIDAIEKGNTFNAAFNLKEMVEEDVVESLFIASMEKARDEDDWWWQYRSLQELGWDSEARSFLLEPVCKAF